MPLIETVDLCQRFDGRELLKNINLKVEKGEVFALIGPTGSGKTTLLRLLDLLDVPASGKIYFDGLDATDARARLNLRRRMAFVLQKPVVFNTSVYENIAYGLKWKGLEKTSLRDKVNEILEVVDLSTYKHRNARTLSGGEAQRVAIARAIAIEPEVLLLDEPTANLDPVASSKIEDLIESVIRQHSTTIIMATHDMAQAQRLADRISALINGEIHQTGSWLEVFATPRSREVARLVGVENMLDGVIASNKEGVVAIKVGGKVIEAVSDYSAGEAVSALIRPEEVTVALARFPSSARNSFVGEVTRVISTGSLSRVEIDCEFRFVALVTRRSAEELNLEKGKQVYATFKATAVHVIKR